MKERLSGHYFPVHIGEGVDVHRVKVINAVGSFVLKRVAVLKTKSGFVRVFILQLNSQIGRLIVRNVVQVAKQIL